MRAELDEWLRWCRRHRAPGTVKRYQRVLMTFTVVVGDKSVAALGVEDIERHLDILLKGRSHNTVNGHLAIISSFLGWYAKRHDGANVARQVPPLKKVAPKQRFLSEEEYARVLAVCRPLEKDLIQLYGNTGLRRGEMLAVRWEHVAPDKRWLRVPAGKGGKCRSVPLNAVARDILARSRTDDTFAFLRRYGSPSGHDRLCGRLAGRARIRPFGPHALRHFFATRLFLAGVPAKVVSKILGHSSLAITEAIYCHIMPLDLLGATDSLAV